MPNSQYKPNWILKIVSIIIVFITFWNSYTYAAPCDIDPTPPVTTATSTPSSPNGNNGWYTSPVEFELNASDPDSGVKSIWYKIDTGAWQEVTVGGGGGGNLLLNPMFETLDFGSSCSEQNWEKNENGTTFSCTAITNPRNDGNYAIGLQSAQGGKHGLNNKDAFATATPYENMTVSAWVKLSGQFATGYIDVYSVSPDGGGGYNYSLIGTSNIVTTSLIAGKWVAMETIEYPFLVNDANAVGVYVEFVLDGPGIAAYDSAELIVAPTGSNTTVLVGSDSANHKLAYFSVNNDDCAESYSCTPTIQNCISFKIDQTAPTNWAAAGAVRSITGPPYELYVYTEVEDVLSGLKNGSDQFNINTEVDPGYGKYSDRLDCNTTWQQDTWDTTDTPAFADGSNSAYLLTPETSYCNDDWSQCKSTQFYIEDMAGNFSTKQYCINGPWVKVRGEAIVRTRNNIDMLAEAQEDNTDGLILTGGSNINYFTSSKDWWIQNYTGNQAGQSSYNDFLENVSVAFDTTSNPLPSTTGAYHIPGNITLSNSSLPVDISSGDYDIVIFTDGNLTIVDDIFIDPRVTLLVFVQGDVFIEKDVTNIDAAILSDGTFHTAYDIVEGETPEPLVLNGMFAAQDFSFERTLQGLDNDSTPSETFNYEAKYSIQSKQFFSDDRVIWNYVIWNFNE